MRPTPHGALADYLRRATTVARILPLDCILKRDVRGRARAPAGRLSLVLPRTKALEIRLQRFVAIVASRSPDMPGASIQRRPKSRCGSSA